MDSSRNLPVTYYTNFRTSQNSQYFVTRTSAETMQATTPKLNATAQDFVPTAAPKFPRPFYPSPGDYMVGMPHPGPSFGGPNMYHYPQNSHSPPPYPQGWQHVSPHRTSPPPRPGSATARRKTGETTAITLSGQQIIVLASARNATQSQNLVLFA